MPKSMPKSALPREHPKHPSGRYHLYQTRRHLSTHIEATKTYIKRLRESPEAYEATLQGRIGWLNTGHEDAKAYGQNFAYAIQDVLGLATLSFVVFRHLQQGINQLRKFLQHHDAEEAPCKLKYQLICDSLELSDIIKIKLKDAFRWDNSDIQANNDRLPFTDTNGRKKFWTRVARMNTVDLMRRDRTLALLVGVLNAQSYWNTYEALMRLFDHTSENPSEKARFEPAVYNVAFKMTDLYFQFTVCICCFSAKHIYVGCNNYKKNVRLLAELLEPFISDNTRHVKIQGINVQDNITIHYLPAYLQSGRLPWILPLWCAWANEVRAVYSESGTDGVVVEELLDVLDNHRARQWRQARNTTSKAAEASTNRFNPPETVGEHLTDQPREIQRSDDERTIKSMSRGSVPSRTLDDQDSDNNRFFKPQDQEQTDILSDRLKTIEKYRSRGYGQLDFETHCRDPTEDITKRMWVIEDPIDYHDVWRVIFPLSRSDRQIKRVSWARFQRAMQAPPINCRIKKARDPIFVFERQNESGCKEIFECHAPHGNGWIPANNLYRFKKDLRDTFGMDADRIKLASK